MSEPTRTPIALTPYVRDPYHNFFKENSKAFQEINIENKDSIESVFSAQPQLKAKLNSEKSIIEYEKFALPIKNIDIPPTLKKELALTFLKTALILEKKGLTPTSADFLSCHISTSSEPFFKDYSSVVKITESIRFPLFEFLNNQFSSLLMYSKYPRLVGMTRSDGLVDLEDFIAVNNKLLNFFINKLHNLLSNKNSKRLKKVVRLLPLIFLNKFNPTAITTIFNFVRNKKQSGESIIRLLINNIEDLPPFEFEGKWTCYYDGMDIEGAFSEKNDWKKFYQGSRAKAIIGALEEDANKGYTLLDTGSNRGYFSLIGSNLGYDVRAIDYDVASIDLIFRSLKKENYRHSLIPLVINFSNLDSGDFERFRSDYVIALGFTHHLYFVEGYSWEQISNVFSKLTERVFITEFKPNTKGRSSKSISSQQGDEYELDEFKNALKKNFSDVSSVSENTAEGSKAPRILIIAKK